MLGRLAKWLRILGYDTCYRSAYAEGALHALLSRGERTFLTRSHDALRNHPEAVFIRSDHVGEQLRQLADEGRIRPDPSRAFRRCPACNILLEPVDSESARNRVPEYVFHLHAPDFLRCPACRRHYWHGSHRGRMQEQLEAWGLTGAGSAETEIK